MKTVQSPCCFTPLHLLENPDRACTFCGAPLKRVGDGYELAGIPPIETKAEIAARQKAVAAIGGASS
ncbi:MAG: hypothetical protein HOW73_47895 [Polyangiaceae bacterium]|nr:hypothetical protein [Polyangiaceae bacterium]